MLRTLNWLLRCSTTQMDADAPIGTLTLVGSICESALCRVKATWLGMGHPHGINDWELIGNSILESYP